MRILIIHAFSPANLGDGAIVLAMMSEARRVFGDSVKVSVSATDPEAFVRFLGVPAHGRLLPWRAMGSATGRLRWLARNLPSIVLLWRGSGGGRDRLTRIAGSRFLTSGTREAVSAYLDADLVLAAGGGYLGDAYRRQLPFWHLEYRCAGAAGVPLVFFSQSVGSTRDRVTRVFLRKAVERSALFIARDQFSVDYLRSLGPFDSKVTLCPDVALLLDVPTVDVDALSLDSPFVGVSLLNWTNFRGDPEMGHAAYLAGMQRALEGLLVRHPRLRVRLYPTNVAFGLNPMDDVAVVADMHGRLSKRGFADRCEAVAWTPIPDDFMRDITQCELFIATRMHSAILALNVTVPVVGVAYEEKMRGLLDMFDLGDFVVDIEAPEAIDDLVQSAFDRRGELREIVARAAPGIRARAAQAMSLAARAAALDEAEPGSTPARSGSTGADGAGPHCGHSL